MAFLEMWRNEVGIKSIFPFIISWVRCLFREKSGGRPPYRMDRLKSFAMRSESGGSGMSDVEKFFAFRRQQQTNLDAVSETSSQQERKIANLIGPDKEEEAANDAPEIRNVCHRLYYVGCGKEKEKQEKLKQERDKILVQEMAQLTQRPNITGRAREKQSKGAYFAEHALLWDRKA